MDLSGLVVFDVTITSPRTRRVSDEVQGYVGSAESNARCCMQIADCRLQMDPAQVNESLLLWGDEGG